MSVKSQMETENIKEIGTAPDPSEVKSDLSTKKDVLVDFMKDELDTDEDIKCVADNSDQNEFSLEIVGQDLSKDSGLKLPVAILSDNEDDQQIQMESDDIEITSPPFKELEVELDPNAPEDSKIVITSTGRKLDEFEIAVEGLDMVIEDASGECDDEHPDVVTVTGSKDLDIVIKSDDEEIPIKLEMKEDEEEQKSDVVESEEGKQQDPAKEIVILSKAEPEDQEESLEEEDFKRPSEVEQSMTELDLKEEPVTDPPKVIVPTSDQESRQDLLPGWYNNVGDPKERELTTWEKLCCCCGKRRES
ncbi:unnamed protein product [Clavelina lepadiformis]|uniref:Uncharacterized protein n=1 Tax=Clavelina lepadiformis TaxID=159417 RepID=A0ABP0FK06_CLALP